MEKRSKYDTDPLDPEFLKRTNEIRGETGDTTVTLHGKLKEQAEERRESPTLRYADPPPISYPSVFIPPKEPPIYQPPIHSAATTTLNDSISGIPSPRNLSKLGIPENIASALPYIPLFLGAIISIIELLLLPREEVKTRTHAAQGLTLHIAILLIGLMFRGAGFLTYYSLGWISWLFVALCGWAFWFSSFGFLIYFMWKVWNGKDQPIKSLSEQSQWINQHFEPIK
jgi:hypothetical protein